MSRLSRIKNILGQINPLDKSVREDFGKAAKKEFGVGAEDQRQIMHLAREKQQKQAEGPKFETIKFPMVGTFYRAPSPDSANFTDVGKKSMSILSFALLKQ